MERLFVPSNDLRGCAAPAPPANCAPKLDSDDARAVADAMPNALATIEAEIGDVSILF